MSQRRRAESPKARSWNHDVPNENELTEIRPWVVWGERTPPERAAAPEVEPPIPGDPGTDVAWEIAAALDPNWARERTDEDFVVVWEVDEDEVDAFVQEDPRAYGYAPYLIDARRGPTAR